MKYQTQRSLASHLFIAAVVVVVLVGLASAAAAAEVMIQVREDEELGQLLTDSEGMTLYMFTRDETYVSNCYEACADNWPPLLVPDGAPAGEEGLLGLLGVTVRTDGTRQVTYNGMPLYYWVGDSEPGDTNGQGVGDVWFVVNPEPTPAGLQPSVEVADQPVTDGTVTISTVVSAEPGWLVIHAESDGGPGPVVGYAAVNPGTNSAVVVEIDAPAATSTLLAMLHVDRGSVGTYEFPGDDGPARTGDGIVNVGFSVETASTSSGAGSDTTSSTSSESSEALPETGGLLPGVLILMGILIALLGGALRRASAG